MPIASTSFAVTSWKEEPLCSEGAAKLTLARVTYAYQGDLEGEGVVAMVMSYDAAGVATCRGFERVTGTLAGKRGSFVLAHEAIAVETAVKGLATVVPGSATGELAGLTGGLAVDLADHADRYPVTLAYTLPAATLA